MHSCMEMVKHLILVYKINHKIIGVDWRNGLYSVLFGHLEGHLMNQVVKYLIQFYVISRVYSQAIILYMITILTLIKINGKVGNKKLIVLIGNLVRLHSIIHLLYPLLIHNVLNMYYKLVLPIKYIL